MRKIKLFYIFLTFFAYASCSDDDPVMPPTDDPVNSVTISPKEITFDAIGQSQQFTAKAYNDTGGEVNTSFSWSSSNDGVVVVNTSGMAETTGEGSAFVKVTAEDKTDSALVVVELEVSPEIWWISKSGGNWSDASNWSTGSVPDADDTVAITLQGNYTISLTSDVSVKHITFGSANGNQLLSTGANTLTIENGIMIKGANLQVDGKVMVTGQFDWVAGDIIGDGTLEVSNSGSIATDGDDIDTQLRIGTTFINNGLLTIKDGARILIDGKTFDNKSGAEVDFQGDDVSLTTVKGGIINNMGTIVKSQGDGFAYISPSGTENFVNTGTLRVEQGTLNLRDGKLIGQIDIAEDAVLSQSGNTLITGLHGNSGDGVFEIGGTLILAEQAGALVRLRQVVLDSRTGGGISGPGNLEIRGSLVWYSGSMTGAGKITVDTGSKTQLKGERSKIISERLLLILGTLETDTQLNLKMENEAELKIDPFTTWTHTGSGKISKGLGGNPTIAMEGTFIKNNPGNLEIAADFDCKKEMYLNEGTLSAKGQFSLQSSGKIIGGSSDRDLEANYRRLILIDATSATLAGTIDVDADGELAYMSILGAATLEPSFTVLIDIDTSDPMPAERLTFTTGGATLNGTLEINVTGTFPPPAGAQYQVVSTIDGTGNFININGTEAFTTVQEDAKGVLLIR